MVAATGLVDEEENSRPSDGLEPGDAVKNGAGTAAVVSMFRA